MNSWRKALLMSGLSVALLAVNCEDKGTGADGGPFPEAGADLTKTDSAPPPDFIKFQKAGDAVEVDTTATNEWLVVPYSVSSTEAAAIDYTIKVESTTASTSYPIRVQRPAPLAVRNPVFWARWQKRLAVEAWTRSVRAQAARSRLMLPEALLQRRIPGKLKTFAACTLSSECAATEVCHAGTCAAQLSLDVSKFATGTATVDVKRKGTSAAILVESGATVAETDLDAMLEAFDKTIYPRDVALFGNPVLKTGETVLASDRNADGLVWIVISAKVSENKPAVGFFVANDFTTDAGSNKADILWLTPPAAAGQLEGIYATMAHEFQHLLGFAVKVYKPQANGGSGNLEALWLDEGLSHFAEDACGYGGENTTLLDQEVFTSFGTKAMITGTDGLPMRGMALTFVRYLFEQKGAVSYESTGAITDKGGAAWLQALHASDKTGTEAIDGTFGDHKAALDKWMATIALDGRGIAGAEAYSYQPLIEDTVTQHQIGLKIRGKRKDNTGAETDLQGPLEETLGIEEKADTIPNATGKLFKLTGQDGKIKITVTTQDSDFRYLLIKLK